MAGVRGTGGSRRLADGDPDRARPIIVVDDDELLLSLVSRVLRLEGFEVLAAPSGHDALRTLSGLASPPRLVLTDVDMPGMSGIELAARVRAERPDTPVILMTGDPVTRDAALARPELVTAVLMKPFDVDAVLDVVVAALRLTPSDGSQDGGSG